MFHRGLARFGSELYDTIYKEFLKMIYGIIQFGTKAVLAPVVCSEIDMNGRDSFYQEKHQSILT